MSATDKEIRAIVDLLEKAYPYINCLSPCTRALRKASYRKQEWISVETPPETYRDEYGELIPFLVCCENTVYPFRAMYDGKNWGDGIGALKITHWMSLPEPPRGE